MNSEMQPAVKLKYAMRARAHWRHLAIGARDASRLCPDNEQDRAALVTAAVACERKAKKADEEIKKIRAAIAAAKEGASDESAI